MCQQQPAKRHGAYVVVVVITAVITAVAVVFVHGPGFVEDSCLLVHDATSLASSTRRTHQKLHANLLRMGLVAGWMVFEAN
jgi:hypothetical protein